MFTRDDETSTDSSTTEEDFDVIGAENRRDFMVEEGEVVDGKVRKKWKKKKF